MTTPACKDVYPKSFPWLASFILFFSLIAVIAYTAFYVNSVHLTGVYIAVLVLAVVWFIWNLASVVVINRTSLRTSLVLFALSIVVALALLVMGVYLYVKDLSFLSNVEFALITVFIASAVLSIVFLGGLVTAIARFKPSQATTCRPFPGLAEQQKTKKTKSPGRKGRV